MSCIHTVCNINILIDIDWMQCLNRPPARIARNTLQQQLILNEFAIFIFSWIEIVMHSNAVEKWHGNGNMRHDGFANTCLGKNNSKVRVVNSDMYLIYIDSHSCDSMGMFLYISSTVQSIYWVWHGMVTSWKESVHWVANMFGNNNIFKTRPADLHPPGLVDEGFGLSDLVPLKIEGQKSAWNKSNK